MDHTKIGKLIYTLRKERRWTQAELAERLHVTDKAVSRWERGIGCPDVSLLSLLSQVFDVNLEGLLSGTLNTNDIVGGNMKKLQFYVCPQCGNLLTATAGATISCCGKKLKALEPQKAPEGERLKVETIDNEYFVSSSHEMTKEHYISFVALLTGDSLLLRKQYPEWGLETRLPLLRHGTLLWYCTQHGLFYQFI